jgi:plastocyanin
MRPSLGVGCVATIIVLASGGCGGGSSSPSAPSGPTSPPPSTGGATITIVGDRGAQSFLPNPSSAGQNRMVSWRNSDSVVHRIVLNDGSFDTGNIAPGATSGALTLTTDGTNYHCSIHTGMVGAINASSGAPPPCTGPYC